VFEVTKPLFWALQKNGHICIKNVQNGGASLDIFFKASWLHA